MTVKISDGDFKRLVGYIHDNYGINLSQKRVLIEGRLNSVITSRGFNSYTDFIDMIFADTTGTEIVNLLNKLTTNHTYFMREHEHYNFMVSDVLPYLQRTKKNKVIYLWSAGCSSGEEPYTTQMVMHEFFKNEITEWDTRILATDISLRVLDKAKEAIYHKDSMKNLDDTYVKKYFSPLPNDCYEIKPDLKNQIIFKTFNLMDPVPYKKHPFDLIFCRNVMIYFDLKTKIELVKRLYEVLTPGGYLFIGHAESIPRETTEFEYIKPAIYRKPFNK